LSYVEKHLIPGESVQYQTKLHWIVVAGHVISSIFFALLGIVILVARFANSKSAVPAAPMYLASVFCLAFSALLAGVGFFKRSATEMGVTNKRVVVKTGLADRRTIELLLSRIESIAVEEPPLGRVLGYGTVIVRGIGGTPEVFERIQNPLKFREQVQQQIAGESKAT